MSGRRACKRVKHFGLDLTVPGVLSATRKQTILHRLVTGSRLLKSGFHYGVIK
jgi:hypothetical protein